MLTAEASHILRLSTQGLEARRRISAIRDYIRALVQVDIRPRDAEDSMEYSAGLQVAPGATWGPAVTSSVIFTRTAELLKDGSDDLMLAMPSAPMNIVIPSGDTLAIQPGEAALVSQAREVSLVLSMGSYWAVRVPHRDIAQLLPRISSAPIMTFPRDIPVLSLLRRYGRLLDDEPVTDVPSRQLAARHLQEMVVLAIDQSPDFALDIANNTVASARFKTAKAEIAKNLGDRAVTLEWLAAQLRVTPRYLQRVFSANGTSFSDELRQARLSRARAMLEDPRHAGRTISAIAIECGFPEATALNRLFRQEYGMTPSEVRGRR